MRLGDHASNMEISVIPTGCLELDIALESMVCPGQNYRDIWPGIFRARRLSACMWLQKRRSWEGRRLYRCGACAGSCICKRTWAWISIIFMSPSRILGSRRWKLWRHFVRSGAIDVVVLDSVAALVPKAEIDGEMGDSHMAAQARLMSQALRKLTAAISKSIPWPSLQISCARRWASCSAIRKSHQAGGRSSSIPLCAWKSAKERR